MSLEDQLRQWTEPSSPTEKDKQDRTERMIREAIDAHGTFHGVSLSVYAKGSYPNNTNVRADSDVDIAVECTECLYYEEEQPGADTTGGDPYEGPWTPQHLRSELTKALRAKFGSQVDASGAIAIGVNSSSARVDADIVPCFTYKYYLNSGGFWQGTKIFPVNGRGFENFPKQQLDNGRAKNTRTGYDYKKGVRILKRVENEMAAADYHKDLPSYFIECLAYNCPDSIYTGTTWTAVLKGALFHIWEGLQGEEPTESSERWVEANECFYLFHGGQKWNRADGRGFAEAAWNFLDLANA
jgi:hypothetical protein